MNNPCRECLVNACCSIVCNEKKDFMEKCICDLTKFIDLYRYGSKTLPISEVSLKKAEDRLSSICEKNNNDIRKIIMRG